MDRQPNTWNLEFNVGGKRRRKCAEASTITLGEWAERLARELERSGRERTARAYRGAVGRLTVFMEGRQIELKMITGALIGAFQIELKLEGKAPNTISFYMRMLRSVLNKAVATGVAPRPGQNIFDGVYTGVAQTRKRALTAKQLHRLASLDLSPHNEPGLDDAQALFMFCYHARGMSFVDMAYLKKSDISGKTIRYTRRKTGRTIELAIQPQMRRIIDGFADRTKDSEFVFPIISDKTRRTRPQYESALRRQNERLKEVGRLAGIDHSFSTHSARHSWATTARNYGLPLAVISEGLGHSSQRTTEIYLASIEKGVLDRASKMISEAIFSEKRPRWLERAFKMGL